MSSSFSKSVALAVLGCGLIATAALADHKDWRAHEVHGQPPSPCASASESRACHKWLREHPHRQGHKHHHHFHGDAKG